MSHEPRNKKGCAKCGHGIMWHRLIMGKQRCHYPKPGSSKHPGFCSCTDYVPKKKPEAQ
jgi:hypothetical protein